MHPPETNADSRLSDQTHSRSATRLKVVDIYTDGSCRRNPGPGGWAAILRYRDREKEISGFAAHTTNNQMEMQAVIEALSLLREPCRVTIHTDSQYLRNGITRWIQGWKRNGWKTADKLPVKNRELWDALDELVQQHEVSWEWVKGHSGHLENERCDQLAREEILKHAGQGC